MKGYLTCLLYCLLSSCAWKEKKSAGEELPAFDLQLIDSVSHFNTAAIPNGSPIVLLYFSPDCEHCQKETESIIRNMDSLKQVNFYFITNDPIDKMRIYNQMFKLDHYSNILLGRDSKFFFPAHFKKVAPPYIVVYGSDKKTKAIFPGETPISQLIATTNTL